MGLGLIWVRDVGGAAQGAGSTLCPPPSDPGCRKSAPRMSAAAARAAAPPGARAGKRRPGGSRVPESRLAGSERTRSEGPRGRQTH